MKSFLYHWKSIEISMSKMGLHDSFDHLKHKLWPKERSGVKLAIWLLTIKSQESTQFPCMERSRWRLQLCFRPHLKWSYTHKVMGPLSYESLNFGNFGTPIWESRDKMSFGCGPRGEAWVYYKGEGGGFPQVRAMMNLVSLVSSSLPVACPSTKSAQTMH